MRDWTQEVQNAAGESWGAEPPVNGELMVTITHFYKAEPLDVDNMPKPILDALNGLVYADDAQITDLLCRKRDLNRDLWIPNPSSVLLETLRHSEPFLHVTVDDAPNQEVAAW